MRLNHAGFSLFPLMVTLLAITAGAVALSAVVAKQDELDVVSQQKLSAERVNEAINGFIAIHHRLPCPDSADSDGLEDCALTSTEGLVPYNTLGLTKRDVRGLNYAPYRDSLNGQRFDLASSNEQVRKVNFEGGIPQDVTVSDVPPDDTQPETYTPDPNVAHNQNVQAQLDAFRAGIIVNKAYKYSSDADKRGDAIANEINQSYISKLASERRVKITLLDGDTNKADDFSENSSVYKEVTQAEARLHKVVDFHEYYQKLGEVSGDANQIVNTLLTRSDMSIAEVNAQRAELEQLIDQFNQEVSSYNGITKSDATLNNYYKQGFTSLDSYAIAADQLTDLNSSNEALIRTAMNQAAMDFANKSTRASSTLYEGFSKALSDVRGQVDDYYTGKIKEKSGDDVTERDVKGDFKSRAELFDYTLPDSPTAAEQEKKANYDKLKGLYTRLDNVMTKLFRDTFQRSDGVITEFEDAFRSDQAEVDKYESNKDSPAHVCEQMAEQYKDPKYGFSVAECKVQEQAGNLLSYLDKVAKAGATAPDTTDESDSPYDYPVLTNLGDFCYKLALLDWVDNSKPNNIFKSSIEQNVGNSLYTSLNSAGFQPALRMNFASQQSLAYVLIRLGNNQRLDSRSRLVNNNGLFASEAQAHSNTYDDTTVPVSVSNLSTQLGCPALLETYRSIEQTIASSVLTYNDASGVLVSANRAEAQAIADMAMAPAKLASTVATTAASGVKSGAKFAACAASLGLAVNMCVSAGMQVAATVSYGLAAAADTAVIGLTAKQLHEAKKSVSSSEKAKKNARNVVQLAIDNAAILDANGGLKELNN
ncbi:hypothetical protein HUZ36_16760 [Pseudoalteromonas sp. McH1-7]|uniref:hypothetical protein n=1 Tax=Pseudoalteromonas TaxID=53246 RepID=UPI0015914203|nr:MULTISPECIES: hypothetical protein [Pseudoalteromonas]MDW7549604.1 hypothetical protein [Pseudoalteromonas peptidolytica]NUZ12437.1 hypothetical protein [Pseudoalteromonas sp. McH1-7]